MAMRRSSGFGEAAIMGPKQPGTLLSSRPRAGIQARPIGGFVARCICVDKHLFTFSFKHLQAPHPCEYWP
jgi:hypothetical protein